MSYWFLLALIPFLAGAVVAYMLERQDWNGGFCPGTGKPWQFFDRDSQGGRGYVSGPYRIWISWPGIDRR
jgi:hypothetical protein